MSYTKARQQQAKEQKIQRMNQYNSLKQKIKNLMCQKPSITVPELVKKTGESEYIVSRAYLPVRRELFARASR